MVQIKVNGQLHQVDVDENMPLLWVLRDELGLTGTKYGCGIGQCGACTVHLNGVPARSCSMPVGAVSGEVNTIEAVGSPGALSAVQQAWVEHQVAQCGYCQSGQVMTATALLQQNPNPGDEEIASAMNGNLCRCGTYPRIKEAVKTAARSLSSSDFANKDMVNTDLASSGSAKYDLAVDISQNHPGKADG